MLSRDETTVLAASETPSEKSCRLRAAILAALPGTQVQIMQRTNISQATVSRWLARLHKSSEAHIYDWTVSAGKLVGVWQQGAGKHAGCARRSDNRRDGRSLVIGALPGTFPEISERSGLSKSAVSRWIAVLHADGEARIIGWHQAKARWAKPKAIWGAGAGEHEPYRPARPPAPVARVGKKLGRTEARTSARAARAARAVQIEAEEDAADRARRLAEIKVRRDPLVAALFGPA